MCVSGCSRERLKFSLFDHRQHRWNHGKREPDLSAHYINHRKHNRLVRDMPELDIFHHVKGFSDEM